ncbi:MAG: hypothetical protein ABIK96_09245 [bacterium]
MTLVPGQNPIRAEKGVILVRPPGPLEPGSINIFIPSLEDLTQDDTKGYVEWGDDGCGVFVTIEVGQELHPIVWH